MAEFTIATKDGQEFTITANDEAQAIEAFKKFQATSYTGPEQQTTVNGITTTTPEGMVLDPNTGAMVDAKALSEMKLKGAEGTNLGMQAAKGLPFVGSWLDEAMGWLGSSDKPYDSPEVNAEMYRQLDKRTAAQYPKTTTGLQIGGALSTIPLAGPAISATQKLPMLGQIAVGAGTMGALGAGEGYISGLGDGTGADPLSADRQEAAKRRALVSGVTGVVLGAAAPPVMAGIGKVVEKAGDFFTTNRTLRNLGVSRKTADLVKGDLLADGALTGEGAKRLKSMGNDAMLADAGPATAARLDQAVNMSAEGANIANKAVQSRANYRGTRLKQAFDLTLGTPERIKDAFAAVSNRSKSDRTAAFTRVFDSPIDYADDAGKAIEDVFNRTPNSIMKTAVQKANDFMKVNGEANKQIMANIADDGTVTFRQMPNVRQAHELKRALQRIQMDGTDPITGKLSDDAVYAKKLASDLRAALGDAVPGYGTAMKISADKIDEENSILLGTKLLRKSTTRADVAELLDGMPEVAKRGARIGLRNDLDEMLANVQQAITDQNLDARQALAAWKATSSEAAREKMRMVLGDRDAKILFAELDRAGQALELKAAVAQNTKTAQRMKGDQQVKDATTSGVINAVRRGEIFGAPKAGWQNLAGGTPQAEAARAEQIWGEVSKLLTGPRGKDAPAALQSLLKAYQSSGANARLGQNVGILGGALIGAPVYQIANQLAGTNR